MDAVQIQEEIVLEDKGESNYYFKVKGKYSDIYGVIIPKEEYRNGNCTCEWMSAFRGDRKTECWHIKKCRKFLEEK